MFTTLLRHFRGLPLLVMALLCLGSVPQARATHLYGGEMSYRYLDANGPVGNPFRYEITLSIYNNDQTNLNLPNFTGVLNGRPSVELGLYLKTGVRIELPANMPVSPGSFVSTGPTMNNPQTVAGNIVVNRTSITDVTRQIPAACSNGFTPPPVKLIKYVTIVCLPVSIDGYYCYYSDATRTDAVANIQAQFGGTKGDMRLYLDMAGPLIPNAAPVFSDTAVALVCQFDTTYILNSASDADGDRLTYSFGTPYGASSNPGDPPPGAFTPPPPLITYAPGYSVALPFGAGSTATLNASTGLSTYIANANAGFYVVAVDVNEYRNINGTEVLVGRTRRDLQLVVRQCPAGNAPVIQSAGGTGSPTGTGGRSFTVEEGQTLTFPINANTNPGGTNLTTRVNSTLLDGSGSFNASYNGDQGLRPAGSTTGTVTVVGNGPLNGTFSFTPSCGMARSTSYDVLTTATVLCTTKSKSEVFQITVTRAAAPTAIAGPTQVCDVAALRSYTATGTSPTYNWHVVGGTIISGQGTGTVQVRWNSAATTGQLSLKGISAFGCRTDSIVQNVTIRPLANPVVTPGAPSICRGASTTLTVTPVTGLTYTIAGGSQTVTGTSLTVSPTATTVYTVTASDGTCTSTTPVTVTVVPLPIASPNPTGAICSGATATLGGVTPVAGTTYLWNPTTGLSDPTSPTPTITLTNTTGAPITTIYTLTATAAGCTATGTVAVTVNPRPVANAGLDVAQCGTITQVLGTPAIAGNTYSWTPTTGLSNPNIAQPTVTLTNPSSSANLVTTYTLTVRSAAGCAAADAVIVTVFPGTVTPTPTQTLCSGATITLGGVTPVPGTTYLWNPTTGLNDPTSPTPTLTLTNSTGAPITTTYTLTAITNATLGTCTASASVVVTVVPLPAVSAGSPVAFCSGESAQLGAAPVAGATYSWSPTTGLSNPTVANPTVTLTNTTGSPVTTTYTVTATNATGCVGSATVAVTVNPAVATFPTGPEYICSGETLSLGSPTAGPGFTYSWSPATGLSSTNTPNTIVTGLNTTSAPISQNYTLTITNAQGCVGTQFYGVTVVPLPIANAGADQTLCADVTSAPLGIPAVTGNTYTWSPATGLSSTTTAQPTVTLTNPGTAPITQTYTLTVRGPFAGNPVTGGTSCTSTSTVTITVNPTPAATPGPAVSFCSGGSAQLGVAPVAGTTYSWSPATGLSDASMANPTVTGTNITNAPVNITYTLTATLGSCTSTATVVVTINPAATALPGADRAVCSGIGTALGAAPVAGNTYSWTPATGLNNPNIANPVATITNPTGADITQTYTLTTTNAQGCSATGTVTVTVRSAAVADAGPDLTVCSGATGLVGTPALPGYTYNWITTPQAGISINNGSIAQPTFTVTNTTGGSFFRILVLNVTAPNGCTGQNQVQITINPAAVAEAGPDYTTCSGQPVTLGPITNPVVPGTTYAWTPVIGLSSSSVANPIATLTNTTSANITQKYYLTATTTNGCTARDSVTVTVTPAAVVDAGADQTVCADQRLTLGTPAQAGYTYTWTPATGLSSASTAQPVLNTAGLNTTTAPLTLKYYLSARTTNGCAGRDSVQVTINPRPASANITGSASVCPTVTGVAYSVVNPTGTAYQWLVAGGTIASGQGSPAITVDWGAAGTGTVRLYQVNALGCSSDTTSFPVRINPILQTATPNGPGNVTATAPNNAVCQGDGPYTYATTPYTNGSTYAWTIIGGTQAGTNLNTVSVQWNPVTVPTIGKIVVTETSNPASGIRCLGTSDTLRVLINPTPLNTLALTGPARVCQGSPISFTLPGGFAGSTYAFLLDGAAQTTTGNTLSLPAQTTPGTYTVSVRETSAQGCAGPLITTSFTVDPTPGAATITGPAFVCDLTQTLQYSVPNTPGATYQWTAAGGNIASGQGSSQITVQFDPAATSYSVSVLENSAFGCAGPSNTLRVLPNNPSLALALASVAETSNNSVVLTLNVPENDNTPAANLVQIQRRVAGSGAAFATVGTVSATATTYTDATADAAANSYEYQLELTNGCGNLLRSAASQTIRLQATAATGTGGRDQGNVSLSWNGYVGFPVQEYRIYRTLDGGTPELLNTVSSTTLTATVANGVASSATGAGFNQVFRVVAVSTGTTPLLSNSNTTSVDFANAVQSYNIITPNGDGLNDVLVFDNITLYPGNTLTIFNRWGREVHSTTNYRNNWGGADLSAGTYYYLLKLPNGSTQKSWFEIVK